MNIPDKVRIGSMMFDVELYDHELCVGGGEVLGSCDYDNCKIKLRTDYASKQRREITFLHEIFHAFARERLLRWGSKEEDYVESLAIALHQLIVDNPGLFEKGESNAS